MWDPMLFVLRVPSSLGQFWDSALGTVDFPARDGNGSLRAALPANELRRFLSLAFLTELKGGAGAILHAHIQPFPKPPSLHVLDRLNLLEWDLERVTGRGLQVGASTPFARRVSGPTASRPQRSPTSRPLPRRLACPAWGNLPGGA